MPVMIISDDERLCYEVEGSKFYYHRLGLRAQTDLLKENSDITAQQNYSHLAMRSLESCLIGWENVLDGNGAEVPFEIDLIPNLPTAIINVLFDRIMAISPKLEGRDIEGELKNS